MNELQAKTDKLEGAGGQTAEELSQTQQHLQVLQSSLEQATAASAVKDTEMQQWLADFIDLKVRHSR